MDDVIREKIRQSMLGKPGPNKGRKFSEETLKKMSDARLGNKYALGKTWTLSDETRKRHAEATARARQRGCYTREMSSFHKRLCEYLFSRNIETISEVRFGRYCVDEYDPRTRIAYEADSEYWHDKEYDRERDRILLEQYGVTVIRFGEKELRNGSS